MASYGVVRRPLENPLKRLVLIIRCCAVARIGDGSLVVVDAEDGLSLDFDRFAGNAYELADKKNSEIVVYCKAGVRSQKTALAMKQAGFTNISNLTGGILDWAERSIRRCPSTDRADPSRCFQC
jgi:hypothetical protein